MLLTTLLLGAHAYSGTFGILLEDAHGLEAGGLAGAAPVLASASGGKEDFVNADGGRSGAAPVLASASGGKEDFVPADEPNGPSAWAYVTTGGSRSSARMPVLASDSGG